MSNWNQNHRSDERKDENPPYSRIFIVCSKEFNEDNLRESFEKFGEIENVYMPKDRNTGAPRGVAYIKYNKTSSAAAAIEALHLKTIGNINKPIKVMVASSKHDKSDNSSETFDRIFIKISKQTTEDEIRECFSTYGTVKSIHVLKDKSTQECKGLAYVQFKTFSEAAKAFENCDKKYKAVFAAPKHDLKRGRDDRDSYNNHMSPYNSQTGYRDNSYDHANYSNIGNGMAQTLQRVNMTPVIKTTPQNYKAVVATFTPMVAQRFIKSLFDIVPGMQHCQYDKDSYNGISRAIVTYEDERSAAYAVEKLNNYEFPSGELVAVKPHNPLSKAADELTNILSSFKTAVDSGSPDLAQLANAIAQASTLIKAATSGQLNCKPEDNQDPNYCSVPLPPVQPLAPPNSQTAQRCFIVCKPRPPTLQDLRDLFCRFGDLIEISAFPYKTFAFAKYATIEGAKAAISTLHGATVCGGIKLKVMEADEKPSKDNNHSTDSDDLDHDSNSKKIRLGDTD